MEQKDFTEYIIPKLSERFPQFSNLCTHKPNDIIDINYKSPRGNVVLVTTTQGKEITVGLECDSKFGWHVHMSQFGANLPHEQLEQAINIIDSIITGKEKIVYSSTMGYFVSDDIDNVGKNKAKDEIIKVFYWSEL